MASCFNPDTKEKGKENESNHCFLDKVKNLFNCFEDAIEGMVSFERPNVDISAINVTHIDLETAEIVVDVFVSNPNPTPIPIVSIKYFLHSNGRKLVSGLFPDAGTLEPNASTTVLVPLKIIYNDIKSKYVDIKQGTVIPYKARIELVINSPVIGRITLPVTKSGEIPVPEKPEVNLQKIVFKEFSFEKTAARLHLKLENKNDFELTLKSLDYKICLGELDVGGDNLSNSTVIEKNGIGVLDLPISFRPKDFGSAMWDMIRGKGTGYTLNGNLVLDTHFGPMKLPFSREGGRTKFKKDGQKDKKR